MQFHDTYSSGKLLKIASVGIAVTSCLWVAKQIASNCSNGNSNNKKDSDTICAHKTNNQKTNLTPSAIPSTESAIQLTTDSRDIKDDVSTSNPAEVFVRGINRRATCESIMNHFSAAGKIESLRWQSGPKSERKGYCKNIIVIASMMLTLTYLMHI